ncbi:hypothetical protein B7494_g1778 [Chlorociboria aeruginascens]|nr:hypothetical protein B7494_g1778 [Chlorociboria aeruginascens]
MAYNFTLNDSGPVIDAIRGSKVSGLFVEFLQQGGPKPHVVFRLVLRPGAVVDGAEWLGCRLAMDSLAGIEGVFYITPLRYANTSNAAHASFEFELKTDTWTVNNYISAIRQSILMGAATSCTSQAFIIFHRWGVVNWNVRRIDRGAFDGTNLRVDQGRTGFHEIIGYNYRDSGGRLTLVDSLPLARGSFLDQNFRRILTYQPDNRHSYSLPYNPPTPQRGDLSYNTDSTMSTYGVASPYSTTPPYSTTLYTTTSLSSTTSYTATSSYSPTPYNVTYSTAAYSSVGSTPYPAESSVVAGSNIGSESSARIGEWSQWSWTEAYNCETRSRTNPVKDGVCPSPRSGESRPPYRWPVVISFQDWKFPSVLPEIWTRCAGIQCAVSNTAPQSTLTAAVHQRDVTCRVTAFESGTEVAHLIPEHERRWFLSNSMTMWNTDLTLNPDNLLRDLSNVVLLRSDMHTAFDQRKFVFFPKDPQGFVLHMLEPTSDIGQLYHNTRLNIPQCSLEFLFARFAWSIFPSLSGFLSRPAKSRLVVRVEADTGRRVEEEVRDPIVLVKKATASCSNSPIKRSRVAADLVEEDGGDGEYKLKRLRPYEATSGDSSFDSSLQTLGDGEVDHRPFHIQSKNKDVTNLYPEYVYIRELREKTLAEQRPAGYVLPAYDKRRSATEELQLMGVEILENFDGDSLCDKVA